MSGGDAQTDWQSWAAICLWMSMLLGVTLQRSLPILPPVTTVALRAVGVVAALVVIFVQDHRARTPVVVPPLLIVAFLSVPSVGALLALFRGEPGDCVNHLASILTLVAVTQLDLVTMTHSMRRALLYLIGASILLGLVYRPSVDPNARSYLRFAYDGRLRGLLGSANVLGMVCVLLVVISLIAYKGRIRYLSIGVAVIGMLAASSQTAISTAALIVLLAGVLAARRSGWGPVILVGTLVVTGGLVAALFEWVNEPKVHDVGLMLSKITFSSRTDIWTLVLQQHIPLTGLGQTNIDELFAHSRIQGAIGVSSVHNVFLDGYARDGVFGLIAVVFMFVSLVLVVLSRRAELAAIPVLAFFVEGNLEVFPSHVPFFALMLMSVLIAIEMTPADILRRTSFQLRVAPGGDLATSPWRGLPSLVGDPAQGSPHAPVGGDERKQDLSDLVDRAGDDEARDEPEDHDGGNDEHEHDGSELDAEPDQEGEGAEDEERG